MIEAKFREIIGKIFDKKLPKKLAVAVSGGCDSMALLSLLKKNFDKKTKIFCLTVDHNFRKTSAKDAKFVADFCKANSILCTILKSNLKAPPEADIENSLREMRYNLLQEFCSKNKIKNLFVAHHEQDSAENFLIRLFRGSGIDGLAAMDYKSKLGDLNIIRPLLDFSKSDLKKYLKEKKISWVEDESNQDEKYLRNKIRNFLNTLPDQEVMAKRINSASKAILESKKIIAKETARKFPKIFKLDKNGNFIVETKKFLQLETGTATRYLALALMQISGRVYKPRLEKLQRLYSMIENSELKNPYRFYGCTTKKLDEEKILISKE
ncbi:MAG: putative cell cycle protein MesJ [Rickettsiaceae bacterium]|jgi:tRNA(Ile)-lysidine synthase|nr:putative cell cycle protein MesJ [Rickettsiaceae bacterium]